MAKRGRGRGGEGEKRNPSGTLGGKRKTGEIV